MKRLILPLLISLLALGLIISYVMLIAHNDAHRQGGSLYDWFACTATLTHTPAGDDELLVEVTNVSDRTLYVDDVHILFCSEDGEEDERRRGYYPWILRAESEAAASRVELGATKRYIALVPKDFDVFSMPHVVPGSVALRIQGSLIEGPCPQNEFDITPQVPLDVVSEPQAGLALLLESLAGADRVEIEQYNNALPVNTMVVADNAEETRSFIELVSALPAEGGAFHSMRRTQDDYYVHFYKGDEWLDYLTYTGDGYLLCNDRAGERQLRAAVTPAVKRVIKNAFLPMP